MSFSLFLLSLSEFCGPDENPRPNGVDPGGELISKV